MGVKVVKATGEVEAFNREKVVSSLTKCGLRRGDAEELASEALSSLPAVVTTDEIHRRVLALLRKRYPRAAVRYVLRRAVMRLGPEGYPFERFFARLLERLGYRTRVDVIAGGKCVSHEIDVVAERGGKRYMVECKYHNAPGIRTDVKVALIVYARFLDLRDYFDGAWIATNTKLTKDAKDYAECVGIRVTAWGYPPGSSLEKLVEKTGLYPITALPNLPEDARRKLLSVGVVTIDDLLRLGVGELMLLTRMSTEEARSILSEARSVIVR